MIDDSILVTFFENEAATTMRREALTLKELGGRIAIASAPTKARLHWLKFATFGNARSSHGSLRHNANMISISGVEVDYDGEKITFDDAVERLEKEGIEALVYTSPSHRLNGHGERWRIVCPLSHEYAPEHHERFVNRLAGLYRNGNATVLAPESWTRSQAYYFGAVDHNPEHRVKITEGQRLDDLDELELIALSKPVRLGPVPREATAGPPVPGQAEAGIDDIFATLVAILNDWIDWNLWNTLALAVFAASAGSEEGWEAFDAWSQQSERYDVAETARMWNHFHTSPPTRSGFGSLVYWARQADRAFVLPSERARKEAQEEELAAFLGRQPPNADHDLGPNNSVDDEVDWATPPPEQPWPEMDAEAFHGLAGDVVDAIVPTTEADPVALLLHYLVMAGNIIGRKPYYAVGATRHYPILNALLIGKTARARKGTARDELVRLFELVDPDWAQHCQHSGLSSGEGLIMCVHDEILSREKVSGKGQSPSYVTVVKEEAVKDKRAMVIEPEFGGTLIVMGRDGNILSRIIREFWDGGHVVSTTTKHSPSKATDAHVSVLGHITIGELQRRLDFQLFTNGFINRFLLALVQRGHRNAARIGRALATLLRHNRVRTHQRPTPGRPVEIWHAI